MESAQRALMSVLLGRVRARGLISQATYSKAADLVYSAAELPDLFRDPVCLTEEAGVHACTQNTQ